MATVRVQLNEEELELLIAILPAQYAKLKVKLNKSLISASGKLSGYDLFAQQNSLPVQTMQAIPSLRMEAIMTKILNDEPLSTEEKEYYTANTGLPI